MIEIVHEYYKKKKVNKNSCFFHDCFLCNLFPTCLAPPLLYFVHAIYWLFFVAVITRRIYSSGGGSSSSWRFEIVW